MQEKKQVVKYILSFFVLSRKVYNFYRKTNGTSRMSVKFGFGKHICSCDSFSFSSV